MFEEVVLVALLEVVDVLVGAGVLVTLLELVDALLGLGALVDEELDEDELV